MTIYDSPGPRKGKGERGINNDMTITILHNNMGTIHHPTGSIQLSIIQMSIHIEPRSTMIKSKGGWHSNSWLRGPGLSWFLIIVNPKLRLTMRLETLILTWSQLLTRETPLMIESVLRRRFAFFLKSKSPVAYSRDISGESSHSV